MGEKIKQIKVSKKSKNKKEEGGKDKRRIKRLIQNVSLRIANKIL